jgi:hypothetical protein
MKIRKAVTKTFVTAYPIRRKGWREGLYMEARQTSEEATTDLVFFDGVGIYTKYITVEDILADDWEVVE